MNNLQEATERICELKGNVMSLDALCTALLQQMAPPARERFRRTFEGWAEIARTALLHAEISEHTIAAFERDTQRIGALIETLEHRQRPPRTYLRRLFPNPLHDCLPTGSNSAWPGTLHLLRRTRYSLQFGS